MMILMWHENVNHQYILFYRMLENDIILSNEKTRLKPNAMWRKEYRRKSSTTERKSGDGTRESRAAIRA